MPYCSAALAIERSFQRVFCLLDLGCKIVFAALCHNLDQRAMVDTSNQTHTIEDETERFVDWVVLTIDKRPHHDRPRSKKESRCHGPSDQLLALSKFFHC